MTGKLYGKYWDYGFRSGLYGLLAPEVYRQSLARTAHHLALSPGQVMLDAGCGSGMLLPYLRQPLLQGGRYVGVDILRPGLAAARRQARHLGLAAKTRWLRADLAKPLPLAPASFAAAAAHFSVYTL
ncbi:MAG: class I SAM-dependent methyltransferase, partial [Nitrospinaceae bacterium]